MKPKTMEKKIKEENLLQNLYKNMHNWFWIGVEFDWDKNKKNGKIWVYKDCTGIEMKAEELSTIKLWLQRMTN